MSTIRKISLEYRTARTEKRQAATDKASAARLQQLQEALRLGMITVPRMRLPLTARMVEPRAELKARLGFSRLPKVNGFASTITSFRFDRFVDAGHRIGYKPYELKTFEREPERTRYAGNFSRGTWAPNS